MAASLGSVTLKSGGAYPKIGLGTWQSKPGEVGAAVKAALDAGYRHLDCAQAYGNQAEIGAVLAEAQIPRSELFITSKVWNVFHSHDEALKAVDATLVDLRLDYVDLMLIHWPQGYKEGAGMFPKDADGVMQYSEIDWLETWKALEEAKRAGKVRAIGVSNFSRAQADRLVKEATEPVDNIQMEIHPYFAQKALLDWAKEHGVTVTAYSPLANNGHMFRKEGQPNLLEDPAVVEIAQRHHKSPAQVALRWAIQRGTVVIPKSTSPTRIAENAALGDFELSEAEMAAVDKLDRGLRLLPLDRDLKHPHYPFHQAF